MQKKTENKQWKSLHGFFLILSTILVLQPFAWADYTDFRGVVLNGTPANDGKFYYYEVFVKIDQGNPVYFTGVPSQNGKDLNYIFQYFPTDNSLFEFQVTAFDSHGVPGLPSQWSETFYPDFITYDCSSDTVPFADPGDDQVTDIQSGEVILDGSGSYDLFFDDTSSLKFFWECFSYPKDAVVNLSDPSSDYPSFTPDKAGAYYFRLHVSDRVNDTDLNKSPVRYMKVDVVEDINNFVAANAGTPTRVPLGSMAILDGTGSQSSSGILSYKWEALNKTVDIINAHESVAMFTPEEEGTYTFRLTVITENNFSSEITIVSVYDEDEVEDLLFQKIDPECIDYVHADLDTNNSVDGLDLALFAASFNSGKGLADYRTDCDFDKNLRIEKFDIRIFAACFGNTSS